MNHDKILVNYNIYLSRLPAVGRLEIHYDSQKPKNIVSKISNGMLFLNTILDIVFPRYCISCNASGSDLCEKCLSLCPGTERESKSWVFPLFDYRHSPIKKAILLIKYKNKRKLLDIFSETLYGAIIEELSDLKVMENFQEPILIPIPLSKKRYRERGFNQAELLCEKIIEKDYYKYLKLEKSILIKVKDTLPQARIKNRQNRLKNLSNSFSTKNNKLLKGANIILIDDVTTTGATLNEAKKTLKKAGARKIIAFTIAH